MKTTYIIFMVLLVVSSLMFVACSSQEPTLDDSLDTAQEVDTTINETLQESLLDEDSNETVDIGEMI